MTNTQLKSEALELKSQGLTYQQIADQLGTGKTTVYNLINSEQHNKESTSGLLEEKEEIEKLKLTITELQNTNETVTSQEVELRKLEIDHEFRMEQLEITRQEDILRRKNEELKKYIQTIQEGHEQSKNEVQELSSQKSELKEDYEKAVNNVQELSVTNSELKDDVDDLQKTNCALESELDKFNTLEDNSAKDQNGVKLPSSFIEELQELYEEYIGFDGQDCTFEVVDEIRTQLHLTWNRIVDWATANSCDLSNTNAHTIFIEFDEDLEETLDHFEEASEDELEISIDKEWKDDMKMWLAEA